MALAAVLVAISSPMSGARNENEMKILQYSVNNDIKCIKTTFPLIFLKKSKLLGIAALQHTNQSIFFWLQFTIL